ncbi:glycosyltransferase family 2 protein [Flavimaricola marinus]|uniref:Glycosyl transferase family 2 n=1 Tax=Flavimaricola marinus TaxID=1819565 RepID=A0A238LB96_9RHOB|nr:glycosyltransferase [Flavimaricola marinus]SMY06881.1 Glycosyl transferase family 2 [Flavimaricola marinus]
MISSIGAVAIGRNEGERLRHCLTSLIQQVDRVVYVDSGSRDGSVALARSLGVEVVELDTSQAFTAARGRNAGVEALRADGLPDHIQFVDGDCLLVQGWIAAGQAELNRDPTLGLVTGWRSEIHRDASVYNQMCDIEWHRPAGEIRSCGGDMLVRSTAFDKVDGFNPALICSEDEDFCLRVRAAGFTARRLPLDMTRHDANLTRFGQWWQRNVRSGHGFAEVGGMHGTHFVAERRRVWLYGAVLPLLILLALLAALPLVALILLAIYGLSWWRTARGLKAQGQPGKEAAQHAAFYTLAKLPNLQGMLFYFWRRARGQTATLIEYK